LPTDREILECELLAVRCQRGDRAAFGEIVAMFEKRLFYYLRRICGSEADSWDALQETWLNVFRSIPKLRDQRALPAFLYRTARNVAITRLRARDVLFDESHGQQNGDAAWTDDGTADFENAEHVHHALDQLPVLQREALTLFFLHDLSLEQMAEMLGVAVGTVKSRLHYGKAAMRKIVSKGDHDGRATD